MSARPFNPLVILILFLPLFSDAVSDFMTISENRIVRTLESKNLSVGELLSHNKAITEISANATLYEKTSFKKIVDDIGRHLEKIRSDDPESGVGMKPNHRLFDVDFLKSKYARFSLVGVVLRMDKAFLDPSTCGEVRLLFRLSYRVTSMGEDVASRLPMSLNLVFNARNKQLEPSVDCSTVAKRWQIPGDLKQSIVGASTERRVIRTADYLRQNVLTDTIINFENLKQMEVNLQSLRWPSGAKPDMGGQAEYLLKIYKWNSTQKEFEDQYLEDQINLDILQKNADLRQELLEWIAAPKNLKAIDSGMMALPEKFLTKSAVSVSPGGARRLQNRPFTRLFKKDNFKNVDFSALERIKTPSALLRRLDDHSCTGCHQQKSIAGFHFIGKDPEQKYPMNSSLVAGSPHFLADLPRRREIVLAFLNNQEPDFSRGFAERTDSPANVREFKGTGMIDGWGARCSLGNDPSYAAWTCAEGYECRDVYKSDLDSSLGVCFVKSKVEIGDYCESGTIIANANSIYSRKDKQNFIDKLIVKDNAKRCATISGGFPSGMIWKYDCTNMPDNVTCAPLPTKKAGFNACLAKGVNFPRCIKEFSSPVGLRKCDEANPCRDDYLCIQAEKPTEGVCIPNYFLFQFRVDGHPLEGSSR